MGDLNRIEIDLLVGVENAQHIAPDRGQFIAVWPFASVLLVTNHPERCADDPGAVYAVGSNHLILSKHLSDQCARPP